MNSELLKVHRELIDGKYHSVHETADGMVRVIGNEDDQRPEADGINFIRPMVLQQMIGERVYRYLYLCGFCEAELPCLAKFCAQCGKGVGHYTFDMGVELQEWERWSKR